MTFINGSIGEILINVAGSIAFVVLVFFVNWARTWFRLRSYRAIWKPLLKDAEIFVIFSHRRGPTPAAAPKVSYLELQAFLDISRVLSQLGIAAVSKLSRLDENSGLQGIIDGNYEISLSELQKNHLVLLGAGVANRETKEILEKISDEIPYSFSIEDKHIQVRNEIFEPLKDENGIWIKDYGLIIRSRNPYNASKYVFIAAGCHSFSTYAATKILTDQDIVVKLLRQVKDENFVALVEIDKKGDVITNITIRQAFMKLRFQDR